MNSTKLLFYRKWFGSNKIKGRGLFCRILWTCLFPRPWNVLHTDAHHRESEKILCLTFSTPAFTFFVFSAYALGRSDENTLCLARLFHPLAFLCWKSEKKQNQTCPMDKQNLWINFLKEKAWKEFMVWWTSSTGSVHRGAVQRITPGHRLIDLWLGFKTMEGYTDF
jgi:hypothetical protein